MHNVKALLAVFLLFSLARPIHVQAAKIPSNLAAQFQSWLSDDLWPAARSQGISQETFQAAFKNVELNLELPDLVMPGTKAKVPRQQHQAEFGSPGNYFNEKALSRVVALGRERLNQYGNVLKAIERQTGVPGRIVVAIWGKESGFGHAKIPYNAFEVLGTKAFMSTRKDFFREELLAALQMVQEHGVAVAYMKSSWAGALGQPQFMPSSFLVHARDIDGNGTSDIWNSVPDTLGSIAGYLQDKGWVKGRDWGFEVVVPVSVTCALEGPDRGIAIADWVAKGIKRVNGKAFPASELTGEGYLMMPAGRSGPAFIVTPNFYVLKEYNMSDLYALYVGHSGDRMQYGGKPFDTRWGKVGGLYRSDIAALQRGLEQQGYDVGGSDGLPGFKTRRSIGDWQQKNGRKPTCFPDAGLVKALR